ncbi:MAG: hypothetical protein JWQ40_141, partial [Segetibacter sp.]|nr:hypothetical protein [Segetibacter sp.]
FFVAEKCGQAQDAMKPYTSLFPNAAIYFSQTYKALEEQPEGNLKFGHFSLNNEIFAAMDGTGNLSFTFNEVVSLVVECDTLEDIDNHRAKLTKGGEESMCGWTKDKFGISWQIVPKVLGSLMADPSKSQRVMAEAMKMKKPDIETLVNSR